jgi:hypothetical protein
MGIKRILKRYIPTKLFGVIEPYGHLIESIVYNCRYGFPARHVQVIGDKCTRTAINAAAEANEGRGC